jgi:hypothetical protein
MNLIMKVARLVLCPRCNRHGHLVFSDGGETEEFQFAEDGVDLVNTALLVGRIVEPEADDLRRQVRENFPSYGEIKEAIHHVVGDDPQVFEVMPSDEFLQGDYQKPTIH